LNSHLALQWSCFVGVIDFHALKMIEFGKCRTRNKSIEETRQTFGFAHVISLRKEGKYKYL
jgi:hypothetical protein